MKELKTWADLSNAYSLVLFNSCVDIADGAVLMEWQEQHECEPEPEDQDPKDYYCECEVAQWYAISVSFSDKEYLNKEFDLDIFYSETLGIYILPVSHFGTGWDMLNLKGGYATE